MVRSKSSIKTAVEALTAREPAFARVIDKSGVPELPTRDSPDRSEPSTMVSAVSSGCL